MEGEVRRRWRPYRTEAATSGSGRSPVQEDLAKLQVLDPDDAASIVAELRRVAVKGLRWKTVRHLRGDIYEVRISGRRADYRLLFGVEGSRGQILLSLLLYEKKSRTTPARIINLAESRLRDWRRRAK